LGAGSIVAMPIPANLSACFSSKPDLPSPQLIEVGIISPSKISYH
jgi:hypothetical protein